MDDVVFFKCFANVKALQLVLHEHENLVADLVGIENTLLELWGENRKVVELQKLLEESHAKLAALNKYCGVQ